MEPAEGKALVTGAVQVYFNGKCVTNQASILFNENALENTPYQLDYEGRFTCQLPVGSNYISKIYYQNVCLKIPTGMANFVVKADNKINYLGDLSVDWQHDNFQGALIVMATALTGLVGGLVMLELTEAYSQEEYQQLLYVENNLEEAKNYLISEYNTNLDLLDLTFNFPEPGTYFDPIEPVDHSLNPNFLTFSTHNKKICYGNLRYLKKNKIYVQCENIIYVIPKKNLNSITNYTGANISLQSISQKKFEPLNYDSYEFIQF